MHLYQVVCRVDNGCRIENWLSLVSAQSIDDATGVVLNHWNSQYDTTASLTSAQELIELNTPTIIFQKEYHE